MTHVKIRNPIGVFFLAFFTGGIYYFYWFYSVNSEAAILSNDKDAKPGLSLLAATLGWLLIIPPFVTHWRTAERVGRATGRPPSLAAQIVLSIILLPFAALLYTWWLQGKMNKAVRAHAGQQHAAMQPA